MYIYSTLYDVSIGHTSPGLAKISGMENLASTEELNQSKDNGETPKVSNIDLCDMPTIARE